MRRSMEGRIQELDIDSCKYALTMISCEVPFAVALQIAEEKQKRERT